MLKYKCLVLDHDDTGVNSTPTIHYPAHLKVVEELRPQIAPISLDQWYLKNFSPGILEYLTQELNFTEKEVLREYEIWQDYNKDHFPEFFPGFKELLIDFHNAGGIITVVSHSSPEIIRRDYKRGGIDFLLKDVHGWTEDKVKRKPSPFPVNEILKNHNLKPHEALIVDDLKPAVDMSKASGVPMVAAGWGHQIPQIIKFMEENTLAYLKSIDQLREHLFTSI